MPADINLKELWGRQTATAPDSSEIIRKANGYKRKHLVKLITTNVLLVLTSIFIGWVIYEYQPQMLTTKIGSVLVVLAMVIFLVVYNRMMPLLLKIDSNTSTAAYLQRLLKLKAKQKFLHSTMLNVYYIMLSTGIFLYMIEPTMHAPVLNIILTYGLTAAWIIFSWFYFRVRAIKKQEKAINELVEKFEALGQQLQG